MTKKKNRYSHKIGQNDACWCGSGKKYKKCHWNQANQQPMPRSEIFQQHRNAFTVPQCSSPTEWLEECSQVIVSAHTIPKSTSLKAIARDGHVYSFDAASLADIFKNKGVLRPKLVGIGQASTFRGFCSVHDNRIFAPIEKQDFALTQEHCFLVGYRALCRELYTKEAAAGLGPLRKNADVGKPLTQQIEIQSLSNTTDIGVQAGLRDLKSQKRTFDDVLIGGDFSSVRGMIIKLKSPPPVMCCGAFAPATDFEGNVLQDLCDLDLTPDNLAVNSFYGGHDGIIALTWLEDSARSANSFATSLESALQKESPGPLVRLFFEVFENIHMKPEWWESLSKVTREHLVQRMADSADPFRERPNTALCSDGLSFAAWEILDIQTI